MQWTLIGYFPKRRAVRAAWVSPYPDYPDAAFPAPPPVDEIGSVSHCIARGIESPSGAAPTNQFGGYATAADAWLAVGAEQRSGFTTQACFTVQAYRLAPCIYRDGLVDALPPPSLDVAPLPESFERLGYDAVELTHGQCFGCSPLSCNGQTHSATLNAYCLVDTESEGEALASEFSRSKPEPGPYALVEVWRDRSDGAGR